jgi:hypothetical protein
MTDMFTYFVVETSDEARKDASVALWLMRPVDQVAELPDGRLLAILSSPYREDDFKCVKTAVMALSGVSAIFPNCDFGFHGYFGSELVDGINKFFSDRRPKPPTTDDKLERFVSELRTWKTIFNAVREAAYSSARK